MLIKKYKISIDDSKIIEAGFQLEDGYNTMIRLIEKGYIPEGIFCVNEPVALGVIKALKKHNYRIPEDVAVMSFTETKLSSLTAPTISSVQQPSQEIGETAAKLLIKHIEANSNSKHETITLNGKLNIRESTTKI